MARKILIVLVFVVILGGTIGMGKKTDAIILTRVGDIVGQKVMNILPARKDLAGPLNALQTSAVMTAQERVRFRLKTEKSLEGLRIQVLGEGGEVRLVGFVNDAEQRVKAIEVAQNTAGVTQVISELAEPMGR